MEEQRAQEKTRDIKAWHVFIAWIVMILLNNLVLQPAGGLFAFGGDLLSTGLFFAFLFYGIRAISRWDRARIARKKKA